MDVLDDSDDFITVDLQPRDKIIDRLIVLRTLVERSLLEAMAESDGVTDEIEERRFDLLAALLVTKAANAVAADELEILQTPIGQIPEEKEVAVILAAEAFGAIGRACGLVRDLPLPPNPVGSSEDVLQLILAMDTEEIEERLTLPSEEAAATILEIAEVIHWRSDIEFGSRLSGGELTPDEMESAMAVAAEAKASELLQTYPSGDLKLGHKPIRKWSDDEVETFYIVSLQQRNAIEWLCSAGQEWTVISDEGE